MTQDCTNAPDDLASLSDFRVTCWSRRGLPICNFHYRRCSITSQKPVSNTVSGSVRRKLLTLPHDSESCADRWERWGLRFSLVTSAEADMPRLIWAGDAYGVLCTASRSKIRALQYRGDEPTLPTEPVPSVCQTDVQSMCQNFSSSEVGTISKRSTLLLHYIHRGLPRSVESRHDYVSWGD